jgi:hypothetical protein
VLLDAFVRLTPLFALRTTSDGLAFEAIGIHRVEERESETGNAVEILKYVDKWIGEANVEGGRTRVAGLMHQFRVGLPSCSPAPFRHHPHPRPCLNRSWAPVVVELMGKKKVRRENQNEKPLELR